MGVIVGAVGVAGAVLAGRLALMSVSYVVAGVLLGGRAVMALGRAAQVVWWPPGCVPYTGATTWDRTWFLLTFGPIHAMFGPGSFGRSYALLVVPALGASIIACAALVVRSPLLELLKEGWRQALGITLFSVAGSLLDDAIRRLLLPGRPFAAAVRICTASWLAFGGTISLGTSFETEQQVAWARALALLSSAIVSGAGSVTLLQEGSMPAAAAGLPAADGGPQDGSGYQAEDRLAFIFYGGALLLASSVSASLFTGNPFLLRVARGILNVLRTLVSVEELIRNAWRGLKWLWQRPAVQAAARTVRRVDDAVTNALVRTAHRTATIAARVARAVSRSVIAVRNAVWPALCLILRGIHTNVLVPAGRISVTVAKASVRGAKAVVKATYTHVLVPTWRALLAAARATARAAVSAAKAAHRWLLRPLLTLFGSYCAPVLWPAGTVFATAMFLRLALVERVPWPFGAAAYVSAVVSGLMLGKAMRRSGVPGLSGLGGAIEDVCARAYLHLDFGTARLARRVLRAVARALVTAALYAATTGQYLLSLLMSPLLAMLFAMATAAWWALEQTLIILSPYVTAVYDTARAAVLTVWRHPELALMLSGVAVAAAYGAHVAGLPAAAWRGAWWAALAVGRGVAHVALLAAGPVLRLLAAVATRAAHALGVSATLSTAAAHCASATMVTWGARAATDITALFASASFGVAFVALNIAHAVLLKSHVVHELRGQGEVGRAAELPIVSFVARTTAKVALGPMYAAAAASLLPGGGGAVAAHLAGATAPLLCVLYLGTLYVEAGRRMRLSYDLRDTSELTRVLRDLRAARELRRGRVPALASAPPRAPAPAPAPGAASERGTAPPVVLSAAPAAQQAASSALPTPSSSTLDGAQRSLLEELRRQRLPAHVFPTDTCSICFDELKMGNALLVDDDAGDDAAQPLRCGHVYHRTCILAWLGRNPRCPCCREPAVGRSRHANALF